MRPALLLGGGGGEEEEEEKRPSLHNTALVWENENIYGSSQLTCK